MKNGPHVGKKTKRPKKNPPFPPSAPLIEFHISFSLLLSLTSHTHTPTERERERERERMWRSSWGYSENGHSSEEPTCHHF